MPTTGTSALLLKAPSLRARNVLSQDISYALEIFTDTNITNATYGIASGVFRFVTDRPGYIGTVVPKYGPDEIDKDGTPIGGNSINEYFYEGFLLKEWITGNPTRAIDIIITGAYSSDSKFSFKIRNDQKFWDFCQTNGINLTGCRVVLWVSIDAVFYQLSRGRVVNNPYTETEYTWNVSDDATLIHKNLPPRLSVLPSDSSTLSSVNQGDPIPVVFGNVAYSKILKNNGNNKILVLNDPYLPAAAIDYTPYSDGTYYLNIITDKTHYSISDTRLVGKFISVIAGLFSGSPVNIDRVYKIVGNSASVHYTDYYVVTLIINSPLVSTAGSNSSDDILLDYSVFNNPANGYCLSGTLGGTLTSGSKTWWFEISDYSVVSWVSNYNALISNIYEYNSASNTYIDVNGILAILPSSSSVVSLVSNTASKDGKTLQYERINIPLVGYGMGTAVNTPLYYYNSQSDIELVTDKLRSTSKYFSLGLSYGGNVGFLFADYATQPVQPASSNVVLTNDYSAIYLCVDLAFLNTPTPDALLLVHSLQAIITDINNCEIYCGASSTPDGTITVNNTTKDANFTPNNLVLDSSTYPQSYFPKQAKTAGQTYRYILKLPDTTPSVFVSAHIKKVRLQLRIDNRYTNLMDIYVREIALIGERSIDTITADLFTKVTGEVTTVGSLATNNLYTTFKHILEDYDGIPAALIDYGNLATRRNNWYTARTITDQQNSVSYLGELCAHGFVGMFTGRTGKRVLRDIMTDGVSLIPIIGNGKTTIHDKSLILRDSISSFKKSDDSKIYNSFSMKYQYDQGSQKYTRSFSVANVDQGSFPASGTADPNDSSIPKWWSYFSGLPVSAGDWTLNYTSSKAIWDLCHASYVKNKVVRTTQNDLTELPWFIDTTVFTATDTTGSGINSTAYKLLKLLSQWTTVQKDIVAYSIPLTAETYGTELLDLVYFNDDIYTKGVSRLGFVVSNEVDPSGNQLNLQVVLV